MRSPINAPILATSFAIGLGFLAQSASSEEPYQGPIQSLWSFACDETKQDVQLDLDNPKYTVDL